MDSEELMYKQIDKLCESVDSLKGEVTALTLRFNKFEDGRQFKNKVYTWIGGAVLALLSTDAFLDLITNHINIRI